MWFVWLLVVVCGVIVVCGGWLCCGSRWIGFCLMGSSGIVVSVCCCCRLWF